MFIWKSDVWVIMCREFHLMVSYLELREQVRSVCNFKRKRRHSPVWSLIRNKSKSNFLLDFKSNKRIRIPAANKESHVYSRSSNPEIADFIGNISPDFEYLVMYVIFIACDPM